MKTKNERVLHHKIFYFSFDINQNLLLTRCFQHQNFLHLKNNKIYLNHFN